MDAIIGAAMLFRRELLMKVGVLDTSLTMYGEDVNYCYRAHRSGLKVYYLAEAVINHFGGQSSSQVRLQAKILILEASSEFFKMHGDRIERIS